MGSIGLYQLQIFHSIYLSWQKKGASLPWPWNSFSINYPPTLILWAERSKQFNNQTHIFQGLLGWVSLDLYSCNISFVYINKSYYDCSWIRMLNMWTLGFWEAWWQSTETSNKINKLSQEVELDQSTSVGFYQLLLKCHKHCCHLEPRLHGMQGRAPRSKACPSYHQDILPELKSESSSVIRDLTHPVYDLFVWKEGSCDKIQDKQTETDFYKN